MATLFEDAKNKAFAHLNKFIGRTKKKPHETEILTDMIITMVYDITNEFDNRLMIMSVMLKRKDDDFKRLKMQNDQYEDFIKGFFMGAMEKEDVTPGPAFLPSMTVLPMVEGAVS